MHLKTKRAAPAYSREVSCSPIVLVTHTSPQSHSFCSWFIFVFMLVTFISSVIFMEMSMIYELKRTSFSYTRKTVYPLIQVFWRRSHLWQSRSQVTSGPGPGTQYQLSLVTTPGASFDSFPNLSGFSSMNYNALETYYVPLTRDSPRSNIAHFCVLQ